jgi:hypothetical protein
VVLCASKPACRPPGYMEEIKIILTLVGIIGGIIALIITWDNMVK